jgi:hypothetical protein
MATLRELSIFGASVLTLLSLALFALWHVKSRPLVLFLSGLAGFFTFFLVAVALALVAGESAATSLYVRVFGLAPLLAHAIDPNSFDGEGLVLVDPWVGQWVEASVRIGFWTLVFAGVYIIGVGRIRRTT